MAGDGILITGATGLVGQRLVERLDGATLTITVRKPLPPGHPWNHRPDIRIVRTGDIETADDLDAAFDGVDRVAHLAGHAHVIASATSATAAAASPTMLANAVATRRLVEAAARRGVKTFIHVSSIAAVAPNAVPAVVDDDTVPAPPTLYGRAKLIAEGHVAGLVPAGVLAVSLRPTLVVGAKARGNLALLVRAAKSALPLPLAGLRNRRSLVSLEALCDAIAGLVEGGFAPEMSGAYAIADPEPLSVAEIVGELRAGMGRPPHLFALPEPLFALAGTLAGRGRQIRALTGDLVVDGSRFARSFGFSPGVSARQALRTIGSQIADRDETNGPSSGA